MTAGATPDDWGHWDLALGRLKERIAYAWL